MNTRKSLSLGALSIDTLLNLGLDRRTKMQDQPEVVRSIGDTTDSLTFGQLKKIVAQHRSKAKESKYAFEYAERNSITNELEDWFEYSQAPKLTSAMNCYGRLHKRKLFSTFRPDSLTHIQRGRRKIKRRRKIS